MLNGVLINIDVNNTEEAVKFYTEAFGLHVGRRFDTQFIELLGLPVPIYLLGNEEGTRPFPGARLGRTYLRHWSPIHLDFVVDSIEDAKAKALAAGAKTEYDISEHSYGKLATFSDPFGHGFCLIEFKGQGYGEIADFRKDK
ncbi:VOC family protein [Bdellovibrio sp. 22V]|uniref:VOC family protein n=1 Tax=Bdellovibrio TaxID=958 RepID=UPI002543E2F4|nr:VOC family protein [Bdellovibrio sp. 22V]WII71363.1 VOC family protein [Bdellovibrio sp. 22V]